MRLIYFNELQQSFLFFFTVSGIYMDKKLSSFFSCLIRRMTKRYIPYLFFSLFSFLFLFGLLSAFCSLLLFSMQWSSLVAVQRRREKRFLVKTFANYTYIHIEQEKCVHNTCIYWPLCMTVK